MVVGLALMLVEALSGATIETPGDMFAAAAHTLTFLQLGVPHTLPGFLGNLMVLGGALFLVLRRWQQRGDADSNTEAA